MDINELTCKINGAIFEVNRTLGPGFLERVHENALMIELGKQGLKAQGQLPITVMYKKNSVGEYISDIIVENKVLLELKTVEAFDPIHEAQILNYLKATGLQVGLLVNFKRNNADISRFIFDPSKGHTSAMSALVRG